MAPTSIPTIDEARLASEVARMRVLHDVPGAEAAVFAEAAARQVTDAFWRGGSTAAVEQAWQVGWRAGERSGQYDAADHITRSANDAMLRATAYTLADRQQREVGEVLVELTDPPLRDPHVARVHTLLTTPPPPSDGQVAARLATARIPTSGGVEVPLAEFARQQVATLGVSDVVWKVVAAAGQADAAVRVARLLGTTPPDPPPPMSPFAAGPADPAELVAARIWAAGTGLPPAQHARWFANTWWPYHLTGTTGTLAAFLAGRLGHRPPAVLPAPHGPGSDLFKTTDHAAMPDRSSHDRFVAVYRLVDAACRTRAVEIAAQAVRDHLNGADLPFDEATPAAPGVDGRAPAPARPGPAAAPPAAAGATNGVPPPASRPASPATVRFGRVTGRSWPPDHQPVRPDGGLAAGRTPIPVRTRSPAWTTCWPRPSHGPCGYGNGGRSSGSCRT